MKNEVSQKSSKAQIEKKIQRILNESSLNHSSLRCYVLYKFVASGKPVSASEILQALSKSGKKINKTSVYREIDKLLTRGVLKEVVLSGEKKMYELASLEHHHHLVCKSCGCVLDFHSEELEKCIKGLEEGFKVNSGFEAEDHAIEFFGLCSKCH